MVQYDTCLDELAVLSPDRLQPARHHHANVSLWVWGLSEKPPLCKVTFCPLTSLKIAAPSLPLVQASSAVIIPSLLNSDSSKVTMSLARMVAFFDSVCIELRRRRPPSLLYSGSSAEVNALARPDSVILYFVPLQLSFSSHELGRYSTSPGPPPAPSTRLVRTHGRATATCSNSMSCESHCWSFVLLLNWVIFGPFTPDEMGLGLPVNSCIRVLPPGLSAVELLVPNDEALEWYRAKHGIPANVHIERPEPNEIAHLVEGNEGRIPVRIWLIHQAGLQFPISPMLKRGDGTLPPHLHASVRQFCLNRACGGHVDASNGENLQCQDLLNSCKPHTRLVTNSPSKDLFLDEFVWINGRLPDNFNDRFKRKSENCKKAIHAVNNRKVPRKDIKISHPSLRIEERAPRCDASSSERSKAPPSANPPTIPAQDWEEAYTDTYFCYCADFNDRFKRRHVIPHKAEDDIKISHPSLRIEERAPRCDVSISKRSKAPPSANPPTILAQAWEEHLTSSSSTYVSPESSDSEEEGEKAKKNTPTILPTIPCSPREKLKIVHYFREAHEFGQELGGQQIATPPIRQIPHLVVDPILELANTVMGFVRAPRSIPPANERGKKLRRAHPGGPGGGLKGQARPYIHHQNADAELWKPEFAIVELDRQITVAISTKDHDTSLALARAIMLPKDITDLAEKSSDAIRDLMLGNLESELNKAKLALSVADKLKPDLVAAEQARDASYVATTQAQNERDKALKDLAELQAVACGVYERVFNRGISRARDNYDRQVAEHCPRIYMKGWLACLAEFGIPEDNPAWSKATPVAKLP
ncbi:hypothetical protein Acr_13g0003340 [Actinidia rufa]|uniref:Uncharacterized protein n=1 Tax=Actinidia rufa TaxID=165716 RepID=A0A7J0FK26_9ERIC|nr:hypothetical protein Acr_13g0003340 [Actinidia rufa]